MLVVVTMVLACEALVARGTFEWLLTSMCMLHSVLAHVALECFGADNSMFGALLIRILGVGHMEASCLLTVFLAVVDLLQQR